MNKNNKFYIILLSAVLALGATFAIADTPVKKNIQPAVKSQIKDTKAKPAEKEIVIDKASYAAAMPLNVVANPAQYLNKKIKLHATFDKFSTLGLDYAPAMRDSQKYISFLIKRDDVKDHTVPLSEMKIFIKRTEAEKFIDLESGDIVDIYGKVFSTALGDPWVDVDKLVIVTQKAKTDKKAE